MKNPIETALILAGGLGTRLSKVAKNIPKVMAPVGGRPFLEILLDYLSNYGVRTVILCVGYKNHIIRKHFGSHYKTLSVIYSIEVEPLGTGGAVANALNFTEHDNFFLINGDSYFPIDLQVLAKFHIQNDYLLTCASKWIFDASRYGTLSIHNSTIRSFLEKKANSSGYINGGVYVLNRQIKNLFPRGKVFSFEIAVMQEHVEKKSFGAVVFSDFFIDIGIPNDYFLFDLLVSIKNRKWSLFLDRDGVINKKLDNDYVKNWSEFTFLPGVLEGFHILNQIFYKVFVVTNQQGIGKGIFSDKTLKLIHQNMEDRLAEWGAKLDGIYYCPNLQEENSECRKPNIGMALQAQREHPEIRLDRSLMIGDTIYDIQFGNNAGMKTMYIGELEENNDNLILSSKTIVLKSLSSFTQFLKLYFGK